MSRYGFDFYNVVFKRKGTGNWIFASGDIINNSGKDYHTAVFRLSVFERNMILWSGVFKVMGFRRVQSRPFEVLMEGFEYKELKAITKHEVYFESGY
jgi:hypothetical protein